MSKNDIKIYMNNIEIIDTKNCVFDVAKIENRMKELGALEDIECEIINKPEPNKLQLNGTSTNRFI